MSEYDAVIVGIGTAGETAAGLLRDGGKKVAIIEKGPVGVYETVADALREIPWAYPTYISDIKYMV